MLRRNSHFTFIIPSLLFLLTACENSTTKSNSDKASSDPPKGFEYYEDGKALFRNHCVACHGMPGQHIDGPSIFIRLFERLPEPPDTYFKKFVMDGKSLKQSGDSYLLKLEKAYELNCTHDFRKKLSEEELEEILLFVKVSNGPRGK